MTPDFTDRWARWMLRDRFGGDEVALRRTLEFLEPIRDRVLLGGDVAPGEVLLDVGCGDGLIGFGALPLVGETGQVVFTDISEELLQACRQIALQSGVSERCRFATARAETLDCVDDSSVDVVTTRSVLIFVDDKSAAFTAFHRVLRPGGRLSLFEPISRRYTDLNRDTFFGFDTAPIADLVTKVRAVFEAAAPADGSMMGFDETDLLQLAESAGFSEITVTLDLSSTRQPPLAGDSWSQLMKTSPNANAPTFGEAIRQSLTQDQTAQLEGYLRPLVEVGTGGRSRSANAYLTAVKPMS